VVVEAAEAERAQAMLAAAGEQVWKIGEVVERPVQAPAAIVV
jgi:phosphoribosylaminoimidazole (AIR) synthetase